MTNKSRMFGVLARLECEAKKIEGAKDYFHALSKIRAMILALDIAGYLPKIQQKRIAA